MGLSLMVSVGSLVASVVSVAVGIVAICIATRLSRKAEQSLRESTKVLALTTGQVLRRIDWSQRPNDNEIILVGAPYWGMTQTAFIIEPDDTVELQVQQMANDPNPLYCPEDRIVDPRWVVLTPSGRSFTTTAGHRKLDDFRCSWGVKYPTDFPKAKSGEPGLYTVQCWVPDENYKRLFSFFFVPT